MVRLRSSIISSYPKAHQFIAMRNITLPYIFSKKTFIFVGQNHKFLQQNPNHAFLPPYFRRYFLLIGLY